MFAKSLLAALIAVSCFATTAAQASILITPGLRYSSVKSDDQTGFLGGDSDTSQLSGDGRVGLVLDDAGIYLGGLYRYEGYTGDSDTKMTGTAYGASAGVVGRQFALIGTYILDGERTYKNGNAEAKLAKATGYQVDVMWVAGVTATFGIGPQLTYRNVKYAKSTPASAAETDNTYTETSIDPGIVLWWRF